ncbi:MAG: ribulose-phosphate 3-epimerase [Deltaproteobacteria bacterium GWA2_38_16]|nr:MAG: ribulose-phosphate 3-epimerase [Deltaproteobacteria bacterium GWA2_38_16]OGQ01742.1 MAG: ribulose-phosphate 3-epimerase [Deltaproteobacteria bacterium RIFCSPHIGHO2_02_FULL_38_15]OGQ33423.1 MAG: ribulose-phosphate 3-epimerase [Deltaproteobacteria bacterium RIFCSPLOWO2_01_FULL_38_9]OGQ62238.1 MAG: ribulose-phosphate 3-epimerase [Deltaproteobacteria bacterium RIFCSPLOWO2_12_FULL_38_8]HBQ21455.1 ribulose-phosphate 3-epimerase [Deltaproteobacteria bacterium]
MFKSKIAPSLLSCDFSKLKDEIKAVEKAGADLLHLDVMDGHFVPNLTIGPFIVEAIRRCTDLPLDAHLMIQYPDRYIKEFILAGANMVSFHVEVSINPKATIELIQKSKAKAGLALNPDTPISTIKDFLPLIDYVLVMSVHPGFAGQTFIESSLEKIIDLKKYRTVRKLSFEIEVDGGIKAANIGKTAKAGANIFVAGSGIFKTKDYGKTILQMRRDVNL